MYLLTRHNTRLFWLHPNEHCICQVIINMNEYKQKNKKRNQKHLYFVVSLSRNKNYSFYRECAIVTVVQFQGLTINMKAWFVRSGACSGRLIEKWTNRSLVSLFVRFRHEFRLDAIRSLKFATTNWTQAQCRLRSIPWGKSKAFS